MHLSDHEHILRCRNGHPDDFRFLVQRYERPVFAFVASRLHDRSLAHEVAEEAFVRAFFSLGKLHKPEAFHSWLLGIAGRVALEFQRTRVRRNEVPVHDGDTVTLPPTHQDNLCYDGLDEAIAALPEPHRELILLRYFERLSCQEIADRLLMPIGSVTKTLSRAYAELRALLQAQEANEIPTHLEKIS
jgi:RNA polymerase sigma-70 factor, ECF subfamily